MKLAIAVKVCADANGQIAPSHSHLPSMRAELRMTALGSGKSVRCRKTFLVHHFLPCHSVFGRSIRQIEIPRNVTDSLPHIGQRIRTTGFEELLLLIPESSLNQLFQRIGLGCIKLEAASSPFMVAIFESATAFPYI